MSYTDATGKVILEAFGVVKTTCQVDSVLPGMLLAYDIANEGVKLADQSGNIPANLVAVSKADSGDEIEVAQRAVIRTIPTCTAGVWSDTALAAAANVGDPLYLGESGAASGSQGVTCGQQVGRILSLYTAILCPGEFLTDTNVSLSGTLDVAGVTTLAGDLGVTGVATFVAKPVLQAGASVSQGQTFTLAGSANTTTSGSLRPGMNYINCGSAGSYTLTTQTEGTLIFVTPVQDASVTIVGPAASCFLANASRLVSGGSGNQGIILVSTAANKFSALGLGGWTASN